MVEVKVSETLGRSLHYHRNIYNDVNVTIKKDKHTSALGCAVVRRRDEPLGI